MIHPDDSDVATEFMRNRARFLIDRGMEQEVAIAEAIDHWEKSLLRAQMIRRHEEDLRRSGKLTLHVPFFEAAKIR